MYAGLSGVLYALSIGSIAPESFGLDVSVQYLAMIVLGGLGLGRRRGPRRRSFVSALPLVFQQYAGALPLIAAPGEAASTPARRPGSSTAPRSSWSCSSSPAAWPGSRSGSAGRGAPTPAAEPGSGRAGRQRRPASRPTHLRPDHRRPVRPTSSKKEHHVNHATPQAAALLVAAALARPDRLQHQGLEQLGERQRRQWRRRQDRPRHQGNTITLGVAHRPHRCVRRAGQGRHQRPAALLGQRTQGKVCGKYKVKLDVKDHGYVAAERRPALQRHEGRHPRDKQTIGSPINAALGAAVRRPTTMVNFPRPGPQTLTENPEHRRRRRDLRRRDHQRARLPVQEGPDQAGRQASGTSTSRASTARTAWPARSTVAEASTA